MDVLSTKPRARKTHTCDTCRRRIDPGETYRRAVSFDDGAQTWKECTHCSQVSTWYCFVWALCSDETYGPDELLEALQEDDPALYAQMRRRWRNSDGRLFPVPILLQHQTERGFTKLTGITVGGAQ